MCIFTVVQYAHSQEMNRTSYQTQTLQANLHNESIHSHRGTVEYCTSIFTIDRCETVTPYSGSIAKEETPRERNKQRSLTCSTHFLFKLAFNNLPHFIQIAETIDKSDDMIKTLFPCNFVSVG